MCTYFFLCFGFYGSCTNAYIPTEVLRAMFLMVVGENLEKSRVQTLMSNQMALGSNVLSVPHFYHPWVVKMSSCLNSFGLREYVDQDMEIPPLRANLTIAQIKKHEETMKRMKAVSYLHSALIDEVFTSIMHLETAKHIWDELNERVRSIKQLTHNREFEMLKIKE